MSEGIHHFKGGTSFVGPDATLYFSAVVVKNALKLYIATGGRIRVNRAYTPTAMLNFVTNLTQRKYRMGEKQRALEDLELWIREMRAALPEVNDV